MRAVQQTARHTAILAVLAGVSTPDDATQSRTKGECGNRQGAGAAVNRRRIAALLRELADALEEGDAANDTSRPPRRRRVRVAKTVPPVNPPSDVDRARAAAAARRLGHLVKVNR